MYVQHEELGVFPADADISHEIKEELLNNDYSVLQSPGGKSPKKVLNVWRYKLLMRWIRYSEDSPRPNIPVWLMGI